MTRVSIGRTYQRGSAAVAILGAMTHPAPPSFGSENFRLPDELRGPLLEHLEELRARYREIAWGERVGFGKRPAVVVIDLALMWTRPDSFPLGSDLDSVVEATVKVLDAARAIGAPIFFTTKDYDPDEPWSPHDHKIDRSRRAKVDPSLYDLDPRLRRRPGEKVIRKRYPSAFASTRLDKNLAALGVDTLIVTGASTSHCVYATCVDAGHIWRVIVPKQAVGDRCELLHEVNLMDIDIDLGDVMDADDVVAELEAIGSFA
jgi:nicotinamidase-related amidase